MPKAQSSRTFNFAQALKKLVVSTFVVFTFVAYAIHDRLNGTDGSIAAAPTITTSTNQSKAVQPAAPVGNKIPAQAPAPTDTQQPATLPQPTDTSVPPAQNGLRDGQYTGNVADAYYGNVQVRATIQGGRIAGVQFLTYPADRRTSQRINSYAVPMLQNEAIQVQSAQVDIISGATLTSQAFAESLQTALDQAHS